MALSKKWLLRMQSADPQNSAKTLAKNIAALEKKDILLAQKIASLPNDSSYKLVRHKPKDLYNLSLPVNEGADHQSYYTLRSPQDRTRADDTDVSKEILDQVEKNLMKHTVKNRRLIILCGIGLGYELLTYLNHHSPKNFAPTILVIEKDPQILKKCLEATDLSSYISDTNISFMVGRTIPEFTESFNKYIAPYERITLLKSMSLVISDSSLETDAPYYTDIVRAVKNSAIYMLYLFGNSPEDALVGNRHTFRNMREILENPGINLLFNKFAGKPAIVCASGPSLTEELPLLKTLQDQVLILSAESTFWALHAHGIRPHIMCTMEREVRPSGYFDKFTYDDLKDTYLAAIPVVPPYMYESYSGPIINVYRTYTTFNWLPFDKGTMDVKKSSANMAFKVAHMLGCSPIILLGQDLCFDRDTNLTHVPEHHFGADQDYFREQRQFDVLANDGKMSKTSDIWFEFLQGYVSDIFAYPGEVINCSAKGAYIEGSRYMPFNQVIQEHLQSPYAPMPVIREALASFSRDTINSDLSLLNEKIDVTLRDLDVISDTCREGNQLIDTIAEEFDDLLAGTETNFAVTASQRHTLQKALDKIESLKRSFLLSDISYTYTTIVIHVIQSYVIIFMMNLHEGQMDLPTDDSYMLYTIAKHREFFTSHLTIIEKVREDMENAKHMTTSLMGGNTGETDSRTVPDYLDDIREISPFYSSPFPPPDHEFPPTHFNAEEVQP
jgi:hypothetical protein